MPPRVPLARKPVATLSSRQIGREAFICPSCSLWRSANSTMRQQLSSRTYSSRYPRLAHALSIQPRPSSSLQESLSPASASQLRHSRPRWATTLVSRTAINSPANVPDANRDLYASLERLKHGAADYVSQSRLQLALRGLESATPTLRIGLLGLGGDGNAAARKLARVLLADALGDEAQWERVLVSGQSSDGKALLLK